MAYFRKRLGKWQCVIRIKGHPTTTKTFVVKKDAEIWAKNIELKYFREEIDILKINYPLNYKISFKVFLKIYLSANFLSFLSINFAIVLSCLNLFDANFIEFGSILIAFLINSLSSK